MYNCVHTCTYIHTVYMLLHVHNYTLAVSYILVIHLTGAEWIVAFVKMMQVKH